MYWGTFASRGGVGARCRPICPKKSFSACSMSPAFGGVDDDEEVVVECVDGCCCCWGELLKLEQWTLPMVVLRMRMKRVAVVMMILMMLMGEKRWEEVGVAVEEATVRLR